MNIFHLRILILLPFFLVLCFHSRGQSNSEITILKDVVYGHAGGVDLKLDLAHPTGGIGPHPAIVFFHGGGWQQGNKSHMHKWLRMFAAEGYLAVTVGYRFAPEFKWPCQVEDAKNAVRFLRAHAAKYNVDPNRIGVMGESAGGYLALMSAVTDRKDSLEGNGGWTNYSSKVQASASYFSAADFTTSRPALSPAVEEEVQRYYNKSLQQVLTDFTGATSPDDPILKRISVSAYIDKNDPPVLLFQGDKDPFVSVEQAEKLNRALEEANVPHELIIVEGGGHGWSGELEAKTNVELIEFFERNLK